MYSCTGDSGAPIWVKLNEKYYIIGIHHGGNENNQDFLSLQYNVASAFSDKSIDWIIKEINANQEVLIK